MSVKDGEADKLIAKANKLCQPSVLRLRLIPDWESACPLYEKAALSFRQSGSLAKARYAYEKAADGQERQGSPWQAAKHLEKVLDVAREMNQLDEIADTARRAKTLFLEAGRGQAAADVVTKAAKFLEESDPKESRELYLEAVELMEEDGRGAFAGDLFRQAISASVRLERWSDAVTLLMRFAVAMGSSGARNSQCKAYLAAVVVWLYAGKTPEAWATYQDALEVEAFASSDEAVAADELLGAYRSGIPEAVRSAVSGHGSFLGLDNQIAKLARKLPTGDLSQQSRALAGKEPNLVKPTDLDEEDLT